VANYHLTAADIMQVEVATILDDASIKMAAHLMRLEGVRSLVIVPHDEADAFGIITYSDIVYQVLAEGKSPDDVKVHEVMNKPIISVQPNLRIKYIARLFRQTGIGHIAVVEGSELQGVLSMTDLVTEGIAEPD